MSLKNKIFLFNCGVFFIGLMVFAFFSLQSIDGRLRENYRIDSLQEMNMIRNNLDILLGSTEDYLRILSTDEGLQDAMRAYVQEQEISYLEMTGLRRSLGHAVSNLIYPNTRLEGAVIWGNDNEILYAGYNIDEEKLPDTISLDYLEEVGKRQKAYWGELVLLHRIAGEDTMVFPCSKIIIDKNTGRRMGKLTLFLREREVEKAYSNEKEKIQYVILDRDAHVVSEADKSDLGKAAEETDIAGENIWEKLETEGDGFLLEGSYIYVAENYDRMDWRLMSRREVAEYKKIRGNILFNGIVLIGMIGIVVFVGAYVIARQTTQPLYSLIDTMKKIRSGDMKARTEQFRQKEVGMLAEEFNELMGKLEESMHQIYQHQRGKRKYELQLLLTQTNPHFLYNSLETAISLVKIGYWEKSIQMLQALSDFYRKSLSGGSAVIEIGEEIEIIENYLMIQNMRYENYMEYAIEVEPEITGCMIPKLTLQPLVENALYHGIKQKDEKSDLVVRGYGEGEDVVIEVFDSGVGIAEDRLAKMREELAGTEKDTDQDSFGLYSVQERIRLYYGENYGLSLESLEGEYTQVTVKIPKTFRKEE